MSLIASCLLTMSACKATRISSPQSPQNVSSEQAKKTLSLESIELNADQKYSCALVLLHGYRSSNDNFQTLGKALAKEISCLIVLPRAPLEVAPGYAWFDINAGPRTSAEVEKARNALIELVSEIRNKGIDSSKIVLGGFSQGAIMSADFALMTDVPLAGVAILSGTTLPFWSKANRQGLPVFWSHGRSDQVLSFDDGEALAQTLGDAGMKVERHAFEGAHSVPRSLYAALAGFVTQATQ